MDAFVNHTGIVAALDVVNVDTDQIIPKQFLKRIERTGFGEFLFFDWRYHEDGTPNPDFALNAPRFDGATVLIARDNFGCGSSREHAPWALLEYGFRLVIAPSFADIFKNNCYKNGVLPVELAEDIVGDMFRGVAATDGYELTVDLERQVVVEPGGAEHSFRVDAFRKNCMLNGLDDIGWTLEYAADIDRFEAALEARAS
jgi:3-isopropylmalate/(R)-2-methylmalate dehydratase small subunit